mmetsp:Transcript_27201/g.97207  ORF Transcript_27201/g.97207 Transcript_27201/m.97207 type:complete len:218 (+) Transcript_27201:591-1244(+)
MCKSPSSESSAKFFISETKRPANAFAPGARTQPSSRSGAANDDAGSADAPCQARHSKTRSSSTSLRHPFRAFFFSSKCSGPAQSDRTDVPWSRPSIFVATTRAAEASRPMTRTRLPSATRARARRAMVELLPVPGGPRSTKLWPRTAVSTARLCVASAWCTSATQRASFEALWAAPSWPKMAAYALEAARRGPCSSSASSSSGAESQAMVRAPPRRR